MFSESSKYLVLSTIVLFPVMQPPASGEARQAWCQFCAATSGLSRDLCEQLRLVLEPTQAARLRGDYRTGRRINMRKVRAIN